jgi:hypothetical protein
VTTWVPTAQSSRGQRGKGSFGTRTGIYLAPQRGGANFCGMMGRDIVGATLPARLPSEARGQELSIDTIGLCL